LLPEGSYRLRLQGSARRIRRGGSIRGHQAGGGDGKRDSSLQNSNRVHFPFMGATVHQNAKPHWQPSAFCDSQPYVSDMPVTLLKIKTTFGPEDTAAMITAFEEALKRLNVADREAHMGISVAKKIVRLAKRGECNPTRLTEAIISSFRANAMPM
jgi:hypothetical protein